MRKTAERSGVLAIIVCWSALVSADSATATYQGNGHRYQRIDAPLTFHAAQNYCANSGGHLVTIGSSGENVFVFDNFVQGIWWVWLGGTDESSEGDWEWVTGEPWIYDNWGPDEPTNCCPDYICGGIGCTPEHYLVFYDTTSNLWNDVPDDGHPFVCEWDVRQVTIDIKPSAEPNCFNINGHGVIPVAINGSAEFDVYDIDISTLVFDGLQVRVRGNRGPLCSIEDWNNDGYLDMVCHFEDDPENWTGGDSVATLSGSLLNGTLIEGTDSVCIVP